jgi:hypothetical protein
MAAQRREAAPKQPFRITCLVNGQVTGSVDYQEGVTTLSGVSSQMAKDHGLRSFTIKVNGTKTTDLNRSMKGVKSIELVAKDSRGSF